MLGKIVDYEKWKILMLELGKEAKIPDLWCMSALVDHVGFDGILL